MIETVSHWKAIPFSFRKVWDAVTFWFGLASLLIVFFGFMVRRADSWAVWGGWIALTLLFYKVVGRIVWRLSSRTFKTEMPYDSKEALAKKGKIHSYSELIRFLFGQSAKLGA
jgi:hypothetical protein